MRGFHGNQSVASGDPSDSTSKMKTIWRVFRYLKRYPALAIGMLGCALVGTLMVLVFPLVTRDVLDVVIRQQQPQKLIPLAMLAVLAALLQNGLNSLRLILNNTFEQRVIFDRRRLRVNVFNQFHPDSVRAQPGAFSRRRRALVHADRASALPIATPRRLR